METYPDQYLPVRECRSGEEWIVPIKDDETLGLEENIIKWTKTELCGELELDGDIMPRLEGDYYAQIKVDGDSPDSVHVWNSGGFYLKSTY